MKIFLEKHLGSMTLILSLVFTFIGLPAQIYRIWQTQSAHDVSIATFCLLAIQSLFWVMYGIQKQKDWVIIVPNTFVVIFAVAIIIEWVVF